MTIEAEDIRASRVFEAASTPGEALSARAKRCTRPEGGGRATGREMTLTEFIIDEQRKLPHATGDFTALVNDLRLACKRIANIVGKGALVDLARQVGHDQRPGRGPGQARHRRG